jgi:hypothetical protein
MKVSDDDLLKIKTVKSRIQNGISFVKKVIIAHWWQLVLLLIGVYLPLQIFEILAAYLWHNSEGFPWDVPILMAIHQTAQPRLDVFAVIATKFGSYHTILPLFIFMGLVLLAQ